MDLDLPHTTALLERFPATLDALLRSLPDAWTRAREGEGTWNAFEVVGHLIEGERTTWMPRARMILEHGVSRPLQYFDREAYQIGEQSLPELLDEFARARARSLEELRALDLQPADLARRGLHPALGEVTLAQLLATWPAHDLTHLHQLSRVLAHQCRAAVGPWAPLLGVLQCAGHSA